MVTVNMVESRRFWAKNPGHEFGYLMFTEVYEVCEDYEDLSTVSGVIPRLGPWAMSLKKGN